MGKLSFVKSNLQQGFKKPEDRSSSPEKDGHQHRGITHGAGEAGRHVLHAASGAGSHVLDAGSHVLDAGSHVLDHVSSAQHHAEAAAMASFLNKAEKIIERAIHQQVKADPWMPKQLERTVDDGLRHVWPSVVEAIKESFLEEHNNELHHARKHEQHDLASWPLPPPAWHLPHWMRAKMLYTLFPADKSMWWQLRQPMLPLLLLMLLFPYGVGEVVWLVLLMWLVRSRDEYQIVSGVLLHKSCFFLTSGLLPAISGYFRYYVCDSAATECGMGAPGVDTHVWLTLAICIVQWLAGVVSYASYRRLRARKRAGELPVVTGAGEPGVLKNHGPVTALVVYDTVCFLLVTIFATLDLSLRVRPPSGKPEPGVFGAIADAYGALASGDADGLPVRLWAQCAQTVLGLLSLPFLALLLPGASQLVLHLTATAFDAAGEPRLKMSLGDMKHKYERELRAASGKHGPFSMHVPHVPHVSPGHGLFHGRGHHGHAKDLASKDYDDLEAGGVP
tara:strand:+ start:1081 stop:2592 length:1512 start_codon:yes stop_codon:yes gene_type:complete